VIEILQRVFLFLWDDGNSPKTLTYSYSIIKIVYFKLGWSKVSGVGYPIIHQIIVDNFMFTSSLIPVAFFSNGPFL